jgi:hypothetical protein
MSSRPFVCSAVCVLICASNALAQNAVYQPLGAWTDPQVDTYSRWDFARQTRSLPAIKPSDRPQLAGVRSNNIELLQDALRRKASTKITTDALARRYMLRLATTRPGQNVLNGAMAEALFAERNPDWAYVRSPNAPQHDFTQPRPGGGRNNVQVKFHESGDPVRYMEDMKNDWRATKFAVPDNHVEPLKASLEAEYNRCKVVGNLEGARQAARNLGRVRGIGANSREILHARNDALRNAAKEGYSTYVSFGASLALALGPTIWDWAEGNLTGDKALYRTTRALSLLGVGVGTDALLLTIKQGALRGTLRGNVIVGAAVTITEVTWLLYEHGWSHAFYQPVFYEEVVGGVSGMGVGLTAGVMATAAASETGPWAPVIGTGVGVLAGTVAYIGGRSTTRAILELVAPEMFQQQEREQLAAVKAGIDQRIAKSQKWPPR